MFTETLVFLPPRDCGPLQIGGSGKFFLFHSTHNFVTLHVLRSDGSTECTCCGTRRCARCSPSSARSCSTTERGVPCAARKIQRSPAGQLRVLADAFRPGRRGKQLEQRSRDAVPGPRTVRRGPAVLPITPSGH